MRRLVLGRIDKPAFVVLSGLMLLLGSAPIARATTNNSSWAFPGPSGRMIRQPDALGNRLLDYSGAGYKGGTVPIPNVTVKTNLAPVAGDDGASIQGAINYVASLPLDTNGFRGAVLLSAGEYQIAGSIIITNSGVVLRGVGDGSDTNSNTILRDTGTTQDSLIVVSGSGALSYSSSARSITNNYVPVGARSFSVTNTSGLAVGNRVMVSRPSTANWIQDIGMDQVAPAWTAGSFDIYYDRMITRIEGLAITLNEPIACALEQRYGGGTIRPYTWSGLITNVGIEYIRGVSDFDPSVTATTGATNSYYADENHGWIFIEVGSAVADAWVRNVTDQYFGYSCVSIAGASASSACTRNITVRDCKSLEPVSIITGSRRYAFVLNDCHHILFQNCFTQKDRHQFVTQSLTPGPNVFVDGLNDTAYSECGPHFRWGTGAIWDNVTVNGETVSKGVLAVRNRGNSGTSHGWAGANEVVWNSKADGFTVESPPAARNWLIGSIGPLVTNTSAIPPNPPPGTYESRNTNVFPNSLYYAQLQDRLAAPNLQTREYWLGVIDGFTNSIPRDVVTLDSVWSNAVQSAASGQPLDPFNVVTNNHWIPFTFNYTLSATDRVVAATLALALRATNSATNNLIYLGSTNNSFTFSSLGWLPIGTNTNTTVRVLDLGAQLNLLTNGQLNVAVQGDAGIDWAMLELQVTPVQTLYTNSILPEADAYVRGGTNASLNFGTNDTLVIKTDASADNQRQGYLRWNLTGYSGSVVQARVRLTPTGVGTNGYEHGIGLVTNNNWSESTINWNNQPGGGKRFATWIPAADVPVEFVVTPQVQAALAADGKLSLELFSLSNVGGSGTANYASRENATAALRPQLLLIHTNVAPALAASFSATPTNGGAPLTVTFTDTSTGYLTNRFWSFGDGATTNTMDTSLLHTYQLPGTNTVRLIVSGESGSNTNTQTNLIVAASVDTVGDGIPNWWRAMYFAGDGTATDAMSCATCDLTGTGQNNLFKYLAGLDPTNSASVFVLRIEAVSGDPSQKTLTFRPWATGRTYTPEYRTNMVSDVYTNLLGYTGPATNSTEVSITDPNATEPSKFYRIKITYP